MNIDFLSRTWSVMEVVDHLYKIDQRTSAFHVHQMLEKGQLRGIYVSELGWRLPGYQFCEESDGIVYNLISLQEKLSLELNVEELEQWMTTLHLELLLDKRRGFATTPIEALKRTGWKFSLETIEDLAIKKFGRKEYGK